MPTTLNQRLRQKQAALRNIEALTTQLAEARGPRAAEVLAELQAAQAQLEATDAVPNQAQCLLCPDMLDLEAPDTFGATLVGLVSGDRVARLLERDIAVYLCADCGDEVLARVEAAGGPVRRRPQPGPELAGGGNSRDATGRL